eukprot:CAMPEP_0172539296 /NCGR_PEP_ID=MMETSP1067-20121228/10514_1 /TAXON_ID=265564 ORGANISM="Thalassiosira punctigera, Strain Tpunct2005C2" /NCGR_SAMPLE_ID=MMETSP1067 /ASSEMBLY_ACC=CAM_ASM_000444 /LENGTH=74 /DNA_ID=CAMNT_0013324953 /DNA_START=96 /DNA_END=320 /DNA_ORIENTATION=-
MKKTAQHHQWQQRQQQIQELSVAKVELTRGDTSGLVYVRPSVGAAFMVTPRAEALKGVEKKIKTLKQNQLDQIR